MSRVTLRHFGKRPFALEKPAEDLGHLSDRQDQVQPHPEACEGPSVSSFGDREKARHGPVIPATGPGTGNASARRNLARKLQQQVGQQSVDHPVPC